MSQRLLIAIFAIVSAVACGSTVITTLPSDDDGGAGGGAGGDTGGNGGEPPISRSSRVDMLLVVDNSRNMAEKQAMLAATIPDILDGLFATGVRDVHLGVVSSSLGGHGSDVCLGQSDPSEDDAAHLLTRQQTGASPGQVPTYEGLGFLVWDPNPDAPSHSPPGESDSAVVIESLQAIVLGAGAVGCGFESTLEAWYRFLVDPDPHADISVEGGSAVLSGTDQLLLSQRQRFLRPDSLLSIVVLSDENDCSIRDGGQFFFAAQIYVPGTPQLYHLPKPRPECANDPNDPCCRSCGQPPGECPDASPHCDSNGDSSADPLSSTDDAVNMRCFEQKRRFGIDFLYPLDRYLSGLTSPEVADRGGNLHPNPLYSDLDPGDGNSAIRDPSLVVYTSIVGVPWQLVTRDGNPAAGVMTAAEIQETGAWPALVGDFGAYVPPSDPHMVESIQPRPGLPTPTEPLADPLHGHDFPHPLYDDLQLACAFELPQPVNCAQLPVNAPCACKDPETTSALCFDEASATFGPVQYRAGAAPGLRHLELSRRLGRQAVVGSICPAEPTVPTAPGFAYRPVALTLLQVMGARIAAP